MTGTIHTIAVCLGALVLLAQRQQPRLWRGAIVDFIWLATEHDRRRADLADWPRG